TSVWPSHVPFSCAVKGRRTPVTARNSPRAVLWPARSRSSTNAVALASAGAGGRVAHAVVSAESTIAAANLENFFIAELRAGAKFGSVASAAIDQYSQEKRGAAMGGPAVRGAALDDDLTRFDAGFGVVEHQ